MNTRKNIQYKKIEVKIYKILGWVCIAITIIVPIIMIVTTYSIKVVAARLLITILAGLLTTLFCFTLAEGIQLFMDIEKILVNSPHPKD